MSEPVAADVVRQHLIDPEICIRCNTCEESCPIDAITHDARNYVVDPGKCDNCNVCIAPCPTGAIDSWRQVAKAEMYSIEEQLGWESLPPQRELAGAEAGSDGASGSRSGCASGATPASASCSGVSSSGSASQPSCSSVL